jgi:hypothetical protein
MYSNEGGYKKINDNDDNFNDTLTTFSISFGIIAVLTLIFSLIWFIGGLLAFIASIVCLFYQGSVTDKAIGVILALILGPFYWLYYIYNLNYCTRQ